MMQGDPQFTPPGILDGASEAVPPRGSVFERLRKEGLAERNAVATWIDYAVGVVMQKLKELGVADNALLIFSSDHGSRGKYTCYEACHIPSIARWPRGIRKPGQVGSICVNVDLAVTSLDLAGAAPPEGMAQDGASFVSILRGGAEPSNWRQELYLEWSARPSGAW